MTGLPASPFVAVALKWVDLRPDVDPLSGAVHDDERLFGLSPADAAALEWALRLQDAWSWPVVAVTAGPATAEAALREARAAGAAHALRVDLPADAPSGQVAAALAEAVAGASLVLCGDWSLDRGSGAVPAQLAAHLDLAQALGLVRLEVGDAGTVTGTRRLDHGRREVLRVHGPAVLSFEGASAELRRAGLAAVLAARDADVEVVAAPAAPAPDQRVLLAHRGPYRPRASARPAPPTELGPRERILALTGALVERTPPRKVVADPDEAADLILEQLAAWGYLER